MLWAWLPSDPGSTCRPARFTRVSQIRTDHEAREASPRLLAPPRRAGDRTKDRPARFAPPTCAALSGDRPAGGSRPGTPRPEVEAGALLDGVRRMLRTAPVVIAVSFAGSARSFLLPLKAAELKHGNAVPLALRRALGMAPFGSGSDHLLWHPSTPRPNPNPNPSPAPEPSPLTLTPTQGRGSALRLLFRLRCVVRAARRVAHGPVTLPLPLPLTLTPTQPQPQPQPQP